MGSIGVAGGLRASSIDTLLFGDRVVAGLENSDEQPRAELIRSNRADGLLGTRRTTLNINNDDNSRAFTIKGTTNSGLRSFLTYWRGRSNIVQKNADNAYTKAMREATNRGMSSEQARKVASAARTAVVKRAMEKATGEGTRFPDISIK